MELNLSGIGEGWMEIHLRQATAAANRTKQSLKVQREAIEQILKRLDKIEEECDKQIEIVEDICQRSITMVDTVKSRATKVVDELSDQLGNQKTAFDSVELEAIAKAKSIAIVEGILFAIEEWSDTDVPAADVTLVSQSIVFKTVHEKIMKGDTDYYFDEVPYAAYEVVRRGREYVKHFREVSPVAITEPSMWSAYAHELQKWWVNDGLVLLYGARDDTWASTEPYELEDMLKWKSTDLEKTTGFPYVFDAIELTRKYGDEIRESSGLPEFTRTTMQTRLTSHE